MKINLNLRRLSLLLVCLLVSAFILGGSIHQGLELKEKYWLATNGIRFNYVHWTLDALSIKAGQNALNLSSYLPVSRQRELVLHYIWLVGSEQEMDWKIRRIFADPGIKDPTAQAAGLLADQKRVNDVLDQLGPLVESILQQQISAAGAEMGLSLGGQVLPPVLYHVTPLPLALIISPRDQIRQEANISLDAGLSLDEIVEVETRIEEQLGVSALVVDIGGVGVYPTMVMQTTDLAWMIDTIAHEWTHNYLSLRPLGINYDTSPELRTMNETAASIAGGEISRVILQVYYPEFLPPPENTEQSQAAGTPSTPAPPVFDYRREMHTTRVEVDRLLAEGKIDEAEDYMEARRQFFWENGYLIRRLNQAFFAFHGAYADSPGGAAGNDPVGPAVRLLREKSNSLAGFLKTIGGMTRFSQLQEAIQ